MTKIRQLAVFAFFCFLFFSCKNKRAITEAPKEDHIVQTAEGELNVTQLNEAKDQLAILTLKEAVAIYGKPQEKQFIQIKKDSIPFNLEELIIKQYPNEEYETLKVEIVEASWFLQNQSWIQVWYKIENKVWLPIEILVSH